VADYKDPTNDSCCFGFIPAKYCRFRTYEEDHFEDEGLIFHYEQSQDIAKNLAGAKDMAKSMTDKK